jgi:hypothetical protein
MPSPGTAPDELDTSDVGPGGDPRHPSATVPIAEPPDEDRPDEDRPDEATIDALGKLSEAVEWIERARGHLYDFHQLTGHADRLLGDAADALAHAGHGELASSVRDELVGRNVLAGRWTFQVVDESDDTYWAPVRDLRRRAESELTGGRRHLSEAALKERRRTHGKRHHEATPAEAALAARHDPTSEPPVRH